MVPGDVKCTLTGWGYVTQVRGSPLPNYLQQITLTTISNSLCGIRGWRVSNTEICTSEGEGKGACGVGLLFTLDLAFFIIKCFHNSQGDSGGPLVCNGILSGIVSYGTVKCAIGYPDVLTRVSTLSSWISANSQI